MAAVQQPIENNGRNHLAAEQSTLSNSSKGQLGLISTLPCS